MSENDQQKEPPKRVQTTDSQYDRVKAHEDKRRQPAPRKG